MKKIILNIVFLVTINFVALSQSWVDLRPVWTKNVPNPPTGANYFLSWGMGEGVDEQHAINNAWVDALRKSFHELGVIGITSQDIDSVGKEGIDEVVSFNKMRRRIVYATDVIPKPDKTVKIYILIEVERSVHGKDDFYEVNSLICNDPLFDAKLDKYKKDILKIQKKDEKKKEKQNALSEAKLNKLKIDNLKRQERYERKEMMQNSSFFLNNHNSFIMCGFIGTSYPLTLSSSVIGRHGGIVGIGYYITAGGEWSFEKDENFSNYDLFSDNSKGGFHYSAGIRIYPYKTFFLSVGYGTYGYKKIIDNYEAEDIWEQKKGIQLTTGGDILFFENGSGFGISVEVGASNTKFGIEPLMKIKFCFGRGFKY